jgi:hypothetical protein
LAENSKQENYAFATGSTIQTRRRKIPNWKKMQITQPRNTMSRRFDELRDDDDTMLVLALPFWALSKSSTVLRLFSSEFFFWLGYLS